MYIDSVQKGQKRITDPASITTQRSGHIMLGKSKLATGFRYGKVTVDWLTIWDRPLTDDERNIVHQN